MNTTRSYFVTYGADTTETGQEIGLLSMWRCDDLLQKILQDPAYERVIILTAGTDPSIPNAIAIKILMADYLVATLQQKGFLPINVTENQVDLFDEGKTVSIIMSAKNVWRTCNETVEMLEILKTFQDANHVSIIATKCNWFRTWIIWRVFSDYSFDISGSSVKRSCKYYLKEILKTFYDVGFGIFYRLGFIKSS